MEFNSSTQWTHASGNFADRPHIKRDDGARIHVSGIGLRQENYYIETLERTKIAGLFTFSELEYDNIGTLVGPVPIIRDVRLHPQFTVQARKASGGFDEWQIRLNKNGVHVASGWFRYNSANSVNEITHGVWETDGDVTFGIDTVAEASDTWGVIVDNDGSGTTVSTTVHRVEIGFTILDNYPDF